MLRRVYVHIGLPKTGTTFLQESLWASRDALSASGVLLPGDMHRVQRFAVWDLLGRRLRGAPVSEVTGSWDALVEDVRGSAGDPVLLSEEFLVHARRRHVRRMVEAFAPAEVHVVVTVRDLGRVLPSMWQQEVAKRLTLSWLEYLTAVRDPSEGNAAAGVAFWLRYDLLSILATWRFAVPAERIHVVTVPPSGSPSNLLLERFADATGIDPRLLSPPEVPSNAAIGVAGAEVLRRLNPSLKTLNERQYLHVVGALKRGLRTAVDVPYPSLPREHRGWVAEKSAELVKRLSAEPFHIVGDLADLEPRFTDDPAKAWHVPTDEKVAEAALAALSSLSRQHATYWARTQRRAQGVDAGLRTRITSAGRALGYRAKTATLNAADHNRFVARTAVRYLQSRSRDR